MATLLPGYPGVQTGVQDRNHELVGTRSGGRTPTMCARACAVISCLQTTILEAT